MHSNYGKLIDECRKNYEYIPDEIVIDLVKKHIAECETEMSNADDPSNTGWILEGFPRTRLQALALQQMKIRPDKLFMLTYPDELAKENLKAKLKQDYSNDEDALNKVSQNAITEYRNNIQGVKEQFMGEIVEISGRLGKKKIVEQMAHLLKFKESRAPKPPAKIVILGPPGIEIEHHAKYIATKYRLVLVDIDMMLRDYIRRHGEQRIAGEL